MMSRTKKYLSATAPKISAGSLKIWSLFLRSTPFPTAFTTGTLSLEDLSFKTWRTACITAVKCWLFCRTTTLPATSAGKSCRWRYRGGWTRGIHPWFLWPSTSWRKSSCQVHWEKRIYWISRSIRGGKIGRGSWLKLSIGVSLSLFREVGLKLDS